jgi:3-phenylpropionate/trans-cinnamate dioxygenase ferredoxin component
MEIRAASRAQVSDTEARSFVLAGMEIVLCVVDGEIYALDGICTHEDFPLAGGEVEDGILECPWQGARYEACTGHVRALPAIRPLRTCPVRVDADGSVYVTLPD